MSRSDTAGRFLHSAGAATIAQLWRVSVTFATHLVLRRYVAPADWGLFAWCEVVFLVLGAVRDLGLNNHSIRVRPRPFGNLLGLEAVWGGGLAVLLFFGAPALALAFVHGHPLVVPVLKAMTLFLFFEGLAAVPLAYFDSELKVRRAIFPELLRNLTMAVTAIALALAGRGVWSLVIAQVAASAVFATSLWVRAWGAIPLHWLRGQMLSLLRGSLRLALIWLLLLLVKYVDRLILGARFAAEVLGSYEFAYWAAFIVPTVFLQPVGRAAFPAFVAFSDRPREQFESYRLATLFLIALEVPAALFLFLNAERVLMLIGGSSWTAAPAFLRILCFAPLIDPFGRLGGEMLATRHHDRTWIAASATTLVAFVVGGIWLTSTLGPTGMAWANYLPLGSLVLIRGLSRIPEARLGELARDLAWLYVLPLPFFAAVGLATPAESLVRLGLSFVALALTAGVYGWRFGRLFVEFFRHPGVAGTKS